MRVRTLGAIAAAICAVVALSGCNSKIGAAAVVGGDTISESTVSHLVTPTSKPFTPSGSTMQIVPKAYALQTLIRNRLFADQLASAGVRPTAADLLAAQNTALQGASTAEETKLLAGYGFSNSFGPEYVKSLALLQIINDKTTNNDAYTAQATKFFNSYPVNVNPRYGKWTASSLSIGVADPPAFLASKQ